MKPFFFYQDHQINHALIIGLGASGKAVLNYLSLYEICIDAYDQNPIDLPTHHFFCDFDELVLEQYDLIIVAPGIPLNQPPFTQLQAHWHKVVGDIELFSLHAKKYNQRTIAITGSNGKSTTVTLLHHILRSLGIKVTLGGNIGTPALNLAHEQDNPIHVLEVSSFQLDLLKQAEFTVSAVLNVTPEHLDRYPNYDHYCQSKISLLDRSHHKIMNHKQRDLFSESRAQEPVVEYFNNTTNFISKAGIIFNGKLFCHLDELMLQGKHNYENILAVLCVLKKLIPLDQFLQQIKRLICDFQGVPHRCKFVSTVNQIRYINDSKATNLGSVEAALIGLDTGRKNIILLLGGIDKAADFSKLVPAMLPCVKKAYIYGQDQQAIYQAIYPEIECLKYPDLATAFKASVDESKPNDTILLSPGCASFDAFTGFEQRGTYFEQLVRDLTTDKL